MSKAIRANYRQNFLFPPSLEDWLPADHPARFLRKFVVSLDLKIQLIEARSLPSRRSPCSSPSDGNSFEMVLDLRPYPSPRRHDGMKNEKTLP
jgi:hypothetical protein